MKLIYSQDRVPADPDPAVMKVVGEVAPESLRAYVDMLAFPRHYFAEHRANRRARDLLLQLVTDFGYKPSLQGSCDNIVITSARRGGEPFLLLGAHYDSVPRTPGADDNASALAVCLECARLIARHTVGSVMIVFFNREEDSLLGSREFVADLMDGPGHGVAEAHIFEMVGYCNRASGSQKLPSGLPLPGAPTVGDFLALLANSGSNAIAEEMMDLAACYVPQFPVVGLKVYLGLEKALPVLNRSDHVPFWQAGIPGIMWTDTSEFRNPHYHLASDTPDTLDYAFMGDVTRLALARAVCRARRESDRR